MTVHQVKQAIIEKVLPIPDKGEAIDEMRRVFWYTTEDTFQEAMREVPEEVQDHIAGKEWNPQYERSLFDRLAGNLKRQILDDLGLAPDVIEAFINNEPFPAPAPEIERDLNTKSTEMEFDLPKTDNGTPDTPTNENGTPNPLDILHETLIIPGEKRRKPDAVIEIDGKPVFTKKSLSLITGKAKSRKTFFCTWLVSQCKPGTRIIWADTEQGEYYAGLVADRVGYMCNGKDLKFFNLRSFNPKERAVLIDVAISEYAPDLVVIDGIRDLLSDINNPDQATAIATYLMQWSEANNCHIINILHQNKADTNSRGHIGSELENKAETVISISFDERAGKSIADFKITRGLAPGSIAFDIIEKEGMAIPAVDEDFVPGQAEERDLQRVFDKVFDKHGPMTSTALIEAIARIEKIGQRRAQQLRRQALDEGIISARREGRQVFYHLIDNPENGVSDEKLPF